METLSPIERLTRQEREAFFNRKVRNIVRYAFAHAPAFREKMAGAGVAPSQINTTRDLEKVPVTTKDELVKQQREHPPFGGFVALPLSRLKKICVSPGPLYEPEGKLIERAEVVMKGLKAAGLRPGDVVLNTFSYHLVPPAHWVDEAARALGAVVVPAGVGNTDIQVEVMHDLGVTAFVGTPSFLYTLVKRAEERGYNFRRDFRLRWAFLGAEMYPSSLRRVLEGEYGIDTLENYGTADVGVVAYQCSQKAGLHLSEENFVEIVDPASGRQLSPGEPGEVVVTSFSKTYCLIRFGSGDLSLLSDEPCPCGRTSPRLVRIAGRVGDAVKVRGMFLHPREVAEALAPFPQVSAHQAVVTRQGQRDVLTLRLELREPVEREAFAQSVQKALQDRCRLRADSFEFVAPGTIPPDERRVKDIRTWE